MQKKQPRVGIGVMIFKNNKILLGKRKGSHGAGEWAFPGGHLESGESFEECAERETLEECGLEIQNITFQFLLNETHTYDTHYVHIGMIAQWSNGEPQTLEPDKNEGWQWFSLDELPEPLFEFCKRAFKSYKSGEHYLK